MNCRFAILAILAAGAWLSAVLTVEATPLHERRGRPPAPKGAKLPKDVEEMIKSQFRTGKVTGWWMDERKDAMEVEVAIPGSATIEVVFYKVPSSPRWNLAGFEYPVPTKSLPPKVSEYLKLTYRQGKITEVREVFNAQWKSLGYQVTVQQAGKTIEVAMNADGTTHTLGNNNGTGPAKYAEFFSN